MRPVLTFFFDALKPESLKYMPFLNSFEHKRRLRTELGYSVTCHPSMYSGVHPDKHLQWFVWKHSPMTSPFGWARIFKYFGFLDSLPSRYFLHKYTRMFRRENTAWFGVPLLVNLPLKYWPLFDVVEDRCWDEVGYLKEYPTIFDVLRGHQVGFEVVGMINGAGDEFSQIGQHTFKEIQPWSYFFLGSIDSYSHRYRQNSPETIDRMRRLDQLVEAKYKEYCEKVGDFDFIVFSDHGHISVEKQVDIHAHFKRNGHNLHEFVNLVEANFARFWCRSDKERSIIEHILSKLDGGFILTPEQLRHHHLKMPDRRYGDIIFYLDRPAIFSKTIWGFSRKLKSMHGYLPDYTDSDGVFISQRPLVEGTHVELVDILPTILTSLDLPIPEYIDGQALWAADNQNFHNEGFFTKELHG